MKNKTSFHKFMESKAINVELGLIQDITNEIKGFGKASEIVAPVERAAQIAEKKLNGLEQELDGIIKKVNNGKSLLKEVGLDTKPLDDWDAYISNQKKLISSYRKSVQSAKFIMK